MALHLARQAMTPHAAPQPLPPAADEAVDGLRDTLAWVGEEPAPLGYSTTGALLDETPFGVQRLLRELGLVEATESASLQLPSDSSLKSTERKPLFSVEGRQGWLTGRDEAETLTGPIPGWGGDEEVRGFVCVGGEGGYFIYAYPIALRGCSS
jgi:hypothetical protein